MFLLCLFLVLFARGDSKEFMVKMRDGVHLKTQCDFASPAASTVLERTPYNQKPSHGWVKNGMNSCVQNMRSTFGSEGQWGMWRMSGNDTVDTLAWIKAQKWSNGRVVTSGGSADGIAQYIAVLGDPQLNAQFIIVGSADMYHHIYPGGAFRNLQITTWMHLQGLDSVVDELKAHESGEDPYWNGLVVDGHFGNVHYPAVHAGGWFDVFQQHTLDAFNSYTAEAQPPFNKNQYLVFSSFGHCRDNPLKWKHPSTNLAETAAIEIFSGKEPQTNLRIVFIVLTGIGAEPFWVGFDAWPQATPTTYYAVGDGLLSLDHNNTMIERNITYDPSHPVPTVGGNNMFNDIATCGPQKQNSLEKRSDVLVFTSDVLPHDLAIVGRVTASLRVASDQVDTDFTAKLTDVHPDGTSLLVVDNIVRMRWRNRGADPELIIPGQLYDVGIDLWSMAWVFQAGHSLRLDLSSSNYPRFDANPNNGLPLKEHGDAKVAINTFVVGDGHTFVTLPVVDKAVLDKAKIDVPE